MDIIINSKAPLAITPKHIIKGDEQAFLNLFRCLGYQESEYPIAEWFSRSHGLKGKWIIVSPIHWQATHNDAMLLACGAELGCDEEEIKTRFKLFSEFAAEVGMATYYHDPYIWLLQADGKPPIHAFPPYSLIHQSLFSHLQQLASANKPLTTERQGDKMYWQRFLTEIQMLFASNFSQSIINGVWLWGSGILEKSSCPIYIQDEAQLNLANEISSRVQLGLPKQKKKEGIIWYNTFTQEEYQRLTVLLKGVKNRWYWNNLAYQTKPSLWFINLFKKDL